MHTRSQALFDRFALFATRASVFARGVRREVGGDHLAKQLVRSATSAAANYAEACDAESRADFVHKLRIALKEMRETSLWLRVVQGLRQTSECDALIAECNELISILVASAKTAQAGLSKSEAESPISNRHSRIYNRHSHNR